MASLCSTPLQESKIDNSNYNRSDNETEQESRTSDDDLEESVLDNNESIFINHPGFWKGPFIGHSRRK